MAEQVEYLTKEGYERFSAELRHLREVQRPEMSRRIHEAVADGGDIMENAGIEVARHEQSLVEGRIQHLEILLSRARPLEEGQEEYTPGLVCRNSLVTIQEQGDEPLTYRIVGPAEANPVDGLISYESPLGRALMGRQAGEEVIMSAPDGQYAVEIVRVE